MDASDLASSISLGSTSRKRKCQPAENPSKRPRNQPVATTAGVFSCFTLDGDEKSFYRRTKFSTERKVQVRDVRKKGACLRCRLLKRACSGEDPCKMCISVAKAAAGSRSLMWMECVRPSFHTMNIFEKAAKPAPIRKHPEGLA
ncbi:hypothetical protein BS50DRAFT_97508 [Corynespora cassiicola Philippines]|uniref:Zn(2)-C6 fungal-type domain-containing protein n=1 Tax=Corynespora cassiicola Philippines TaxID=1448308 RepID=A0A2T2NF61_CORCC|nr:hypothetical protein BS50DRAFT_97508 [Corynespora cassiicola Philippines]